MRQGHDHVFRRDQVQDIEVFLALADFAATRVAELFLGDDRTLADLRGPAAAPAGGRARSARAISRRAGASSPTIASAIAGLACPPDTIAKEPADAPIALVRTP